MRMYDSRRDGPVRPEDLLVRQADGTYRPLVPKPAQERCFKSAAIPKGPRQTSNIRQGMINVLPKLGTASWNVTGAALDSIDEKSEVSTRWSRRCPAGVQEVSRRCPGGVQEVSRRRLGGV